MALCGVLLLGASKPDDGPRQRGRMRTDYLHVTTADTDGPAAQLIGYGLRYSVTRLRPPTALGGTVEVHFDGRAREDLAREEGTRQHLTLANVAWRDVGPLSLTLGRQSFGEGTGFLLADAARLDVRYAPWISQAFLAGLSADYDDFTPDRDRPAAGSAIDVRVDDWLEARASGTFARERVVPTGHDAGGERTLDVVTAAGHVGLYPSRTLWLFASGEVANASVYAVPYYAADTDPRQWNLNTTGINVAQLFTQIGYRPTRPLKLDLSYLLDANRFAAPQEEDRYQDLSARARWRFWRRFRVMARLRGRVRSRVDGEGEADDQGLQSPGTHSESLTVRAQLALDLADIAGTGAGVSASYLHDEGDRYTTRAVVAEAGYDNHRGVFAYAGWRSTARDRDDGASSFPGSDRPPVYVYARAVSHALYMRGGARWDRFYGLVCADWDRLADQLSVFAQLGVAWR